MTPFGNMKSGHETRLVFKSMKIGIDQPNCCHQPAMVNPVNPITTMSRLSMVSIYLALIQFCTSSRDVEGAGQG